ncbi:MAG: hypothetical protein JST30_01670 [Armatimonadetes bacterium]|nr:hypothetical protein [Armatimonadota bacterium]
MRLKVRTTTGAVSLQSAPALGVRHFGVPTGGPFDTGASRLANAMLDNAPFDPVCELALASIEADVLEAGWLAWTGLGHRLSLDGLDVAPDSRLYVRAGQQLAVRPTTEGLRAYMAAHGGFRLAEPETWSSQTSREHPAAVRAKPLWKHATPSVLRVITEVPGSLTKARVTNRIDRVGLRLEPEHRIETAGDGLSRPTVVGCVQATPDGQLLVHGPDGPTIGGYDTVGVVCQADVPILAQLRPGEDVVFQPVSPDEAIAALRTKEQAVAELSATLG